MASVSMHRLQDLVRLHRLGTPHREVARLLGMSPNTERGYRVALERAGLLAGNPDELPDAALLRATLTPSTPAPQQVSSIAKWRDKVAKLVGDGATPTAIYDKLRLDEKDFPGSLSAVKRMCAQLRRELGISANDVAIPVDTAPGQVAQVDFGSVGLLWDPNRQRLRKAHVFIMALAYSRHMFARLVFDQTIDTWLALHVAAFEFFGGVPAVMVPDNLKAAVIRAAFNARDEPVLNRSYRELARHFGFQIDPTPAYSPEKKGKVEATVRYVKHNFMATVGDEVDVEVLNTKLLDWVNEIAGQRIHGTTRQPPLALYASAEKHAMNPLPSARWVPTSWRAPILHHDTHALVYGARYSAPWRLIGKQLLARVTPRTVELYWEDTRVATHERKPPGQRSTHEEHLPSERGAYRHRQQGYWEERASVIGEDVEQFVREVFTSDDVLNQLTKVQAIVCHLENYPSDRANSACRRASFYGSYKYVAIRDILRQGLDMQPLPTVVMPAATALERPRFARNLQELLDQPMENDDASH